MDVSLLLWDCPTLLEREKNLNIIFEACNGKDLIEYIDNSKELPDIILMDLKMPEINGVEATKVIHKKYPDIKIIALTSYGSKSPTCPILCS